MSRSKKTFTGKKIRLKLTSQEKHTKQSIKRKALIRNSRKKKKKKKFKERKMLNQKFYILPSFLSSIKVIEEEFKTFKNSENSMFSKPLLNKNELRRDQ